MQISIMVSCSVECFNASNPFYSITQITLKTSLISHTHHLKHQKRPLYYPNRISYVHVLHQINGLGRVHPASILLLHLNLDILLNIHQQGFHLLPLKQLVAEVLMRLRGLDVHRTKS